MTEIVYGDPRLPERFWAKVNPNGGLGHLDDPLAAAEGECWLWTASLRGEGYAQYAENWRKPDSGHRVVYRHFIGDLPPREPVDHLCRVRHCVRPSHLELVTVRENTRRGSQVAGKTHAPCGHPYDTNYQRDARRCSKCRYSERKIRELNRSGVYR